MENFWSDFEYSKYKLLLHREKTASILAVLEKKQSFDPLYPISVELHLTDCCNLNCEWCTDKELHGRLEMMEYETVCALLEDFSKNKTGVTFEGGGEPSLHRRFSDIVRYGASCGASMGLITNGTADLSGVLNCFQWVRVSMDAGTREQYLTEKGADKFDLVLRHLKNYDAIRDKKATHLGVGYVLTKRNCAGLEEFVVLLDRLGVDYLYLRPVEEYDSLRPEKEVLIELKKRLEALTEHLRIRFQMVISGRYEASNAHLPCAAASLTSIIHADGNVVLCEKRRHDIRVLGNVKEKRFGEIWSGEARREITETLLNPENQKGCSVCRITGFNRLFHDLLQVHTGDFI